MVTSRGAGGKSHFSAQDYLRMGHELCRGVAELAEVNVAFVLENMPAMLPIMFLLLVSAGMVGQTCISRYVDRNMAP